MLINIEGTDASGKQTQSKMLYNYFLKKEIKSKLITFPDYDNDSSALVKMYLKGEFGKNPDDVNPKAASIFFACDRYASYKTNWETYYKEEYAIIADRYTTSNVIHQASKIENQAERFHFVDWLYDLEYNIFGIPKPDLIIFLNMPPQVSFQLMENRVNKISGEDTKDIHESDQAYIIRSNRNALDISEVLGWIRVDCIDPGGALKSKEDIHHEIIKIVESKI